MENEVLIIPDKTPSKQELQVQLKAAIKSIDLKLRKLQKGSSTIPKTGGGFKLNENDGNNINILNCVDVGYLLKGLGLMRRLKKEYEQTAKEEGLTNYPVCPWMGVPVDNWIHDLRMRIAVVTNAGLITELTQSRNQLQTFLTEDQRLHITLTKIADLIKGK